MLNEVRLDAVTSSFCRRSPDAERPVLPGSGEHRPGRGDRDADEKKVEEADVSASAAAEAELLLPSATKHRSTGLSAQRRLSTNVGAWTDIAMCIGPRDSVSDARTSSSHQSISTADTCPYLPSAQQSVCRQYEDNVGCFLE